MRHSEVEGALVSRIHLLSLEKQDGTVAEVEVDEVLCLCRLVRPCWLKVSRRWNPLTMSDKTSKVAAYDTVPCGTLPAVELRTR
jgi:hypothetical protein